jgi:hypothetical protein
LKVAARAGSVGGMRALLFLVCLGGAFGIDHLFISSETTAGIVAWPLGAVLYLLVTRLHMKLALWRFRRVYDELDADIQQRLDEAAGVRR